MRFHRLSWLGWLVLVLVAWSTPDSSMQFGSAPSRIKVQTQTQLAPYTLTMPADDGSTNDVLLTDGAGLLSWNKVSSSSILDNTIVNADVNTSAAIDGSKISPLFVATVASLTGAVPQLSISDTTSSLGNNTVSSKISFLSADADSGGTLGEIRAVSESATGVSGFIDFWTAKSGVLSRAAYVDQFGVSTVPGSASRPAFTFVSDGTSGVFLNSVGTLGFAGGGSQGGTLSSSGWTITSTFSTQGTTNLGNGSGDNIFFSGTPSGLVVGDTFSPTGACAANCSFIAAQVTEYARIGPVAFVGGSVSYTVTTGGADVNVVVDVPIAPGTFAASTEAHGSGTAANNSANKNEAVWISSLAASRRVAIKTEATVAASGATMQAFYTYFYTIP